MQDLLDPEPHVVEPGHDGVATEPGDPADVPAFQPILGDGRRREREDGADQDAARDHAHDREDLQARVDVLRCVDGRAAESRVHRVVERVHRSDVQDQAKRGNHRHEDGEQQAQAHEEGAGQAPALLPLPPRRDVAPRPAGRSRGRVAGQAEQVHEHPAGRDGLRLCQHPVAVLDRTPARSTRGLGDNRTAVARLDLADREPSHRRPRRQTEEGHGHLLGAQAHGLGHDAAVGRHHERRGREGGDAVGPAEVPVAGHLLGQHRVERPEHQGHVPRRRAPGDERPEVLEVVRPQGQEARGVREPGLAHGGLPIGVEREHPDAGIEQMLQVLLLRGREHGDRVARLHEQPGDPDRQPGESPDHVRRHGAPKGTDDVEEREASAS